MIKVLFVGSFKEKTRDGSVGGQMFACRSLVHSDLSNLYSFDLVDSTSDTVPAPHFIIRLFRAVQRFGLYLFKLLFSRPTIVLIFSSSGFSFLEKGIYVFLGRLLKKKTIFAPRSGLIKDNIEGSLIFRSFAKITIKSSNVVLCQGKFWKQYYGSVDPTSLEDKFQVQYNWIDEKPYKRFDSQNSERITIVYIGWLEEYKGVLDLVKAFEVVAKNTVDVYLKLCGSGSLFNRLNEMITKMGLTNRIILEGWVNHQRKLEILQRTDVFVLPSHKEGFPNVLLEAMASEIAIITTNIGVVPEVIKHNVNGLLFSPGDVADLSKKILLMIESSEMRVTLGRNARVSMLERHSLDAAVKNFDRMFINLASQLK